MDTKERILMAALALYNEQGIHTVTSRHIAAGLGISPGNLHYHFRQTDDIIKNLYGRLTAGFDLIVGELGASGGSDPGIVVEYVNRSFELSYQYRFIFLHFVEIGLRIPEIRDSYAALTRRREREFLTIFDGFRSAGLLRADVTEEILRALITQIFIVADFWLSNNELTLRLKGQAAIRHYRDIFLHMFYPYLTETARAIAWQRKEGDDKVRGKRYASEVGGPELPGI